MEQMEDDSKLFAVGHVYHEFSTSLCLLAAFLKSRKRHYHGKEPIDLEIGEIVTKYFEESRHHLVSRYSNIGISSGRKKKLTMKIVNRTFHITWFNPA